MVHELTVKYQISITLYMYEFTDYFQENDSVLIELKTNG